VSVRLDVFIVKELINRNDFLKFEFEIFAELLRSRNEIVKFFIFK